MHSQAALENWRKTTRQKKMSKRKWVILEKIILLKTFIYRTSLFGVGSREDEKSGQ